MTPLPIDKHLPEIVAAARSHRALVLVAPPGAGKTTRVPPAILAAGLLSAEHPNLMMLQPRRVAARAAAERIADENGWTLGREAGYHVRFERRLGPDTRLRVVTEGILTRQLLDDPFLEGVGAVLLDEFHERSIHTDLCVALLREVRQTVRDDLILIVMSATLEAEPVARFLGDCPIVRTEGRTFPIEISYAGWSQDPLANRAAAAVRDLIAAAPGPGAGDVLVFLPGAEEIRRTIANLGGLAERENLLVLPLHGSLPFEEQLRAIRPASRRKIILATNVAETSLTIDGVRTVVDAGFARVAGYDPQRGLDRLDLQRISKASAAQRAGRAGRTGPGRCVRLWSPSQESAMEAFAPPEIRRVDLCGTVLTLHAWGKPDPRAFGWYEPPSEEAIASAERLLAMLGALDADANGSITPLGQRINALPVHPRLARLLIAAADVGRLADGASLAALLSEKDIVWEDRGVPPWQRQAKTLAPSDLLIRLDLLREAERSRFGAYMRDAGIDPASARQVAKVRDDLLRVGERITRAARRPRASAARQANQASGARSDPPARPLQRAPAATDRNDSNRIACDDAPRADVPPDDADLLKLALLAYPDRVCRRRAADPAAAAMVGGGGVRLAPESVVRHGEFFLALDARQDQRSATREATVRIASAIEVQWLEELSPASIRRERTVVYDEGRQKVVGRSATYYRDLLLREDDNAAVEPERAAVALAEALRPRVAELFAANAPAANFLARVALLRQHMPEHNWPLFDETELVEALANACRGKRSIEDVKNAPLLPHLQSRLRYPLDRLLEQHAPEAVEVPTGNRIRLDYAAAGPPVLAVRLQEVFGWIDTPRIAAGRVAVLLHLLGPNYRPVQITNDLRSFWTGTYFQVRKDLRVKYPKHAWPDDPLAATPVAKGRPRK